MVGFTIIILLTWLGSLFSMFWIATLEEEKEIDQRDAKAMKDATDSSFFLRR